MNTAQLMKWGKVVVVIIILTPLISLAILGVLLWSNFWPKPGIDTAEIHLSRAGIYSASGLWKSAVEEYQKSAELSRGEKAVGLWIQAGDLCYKELEDYECAARNYLNAKISGKEFARDSERATRLVDSLKKLGKTESADAWLNDLTALAPETSKGSTIVARIGERQITINELRKSLESEPEMFKNNFSGKDGLRKYLDQYLFTSLLYQSALDENLLNDQTKREFERLKEKYVAELYFREKMISRVKVTEKELKDYYDQNSSEFKDASGKVKSFDQAKKEAEFKLKEKKLNQLKDDWFKAQAGKRGLYINADAFGAE